MTFVELFLSHNECALKATVREPRFVGKLQRRREEHIVSSKKGETLFSCNYNQVLSHCFHGKHICSTSAL